MTKAVTLQDVADRAGVSLATASLVLNGRPGVAHSTAETVRKIMQELEYAPPPPAQRRGATAGRRRRLATGRVAMLLLGQSAPAGLSWQVYMPMVDSLERRLQANRYALILRRDGDVTGAVINALRREADGLICVGEADPEQAFRRIHPFPCVWVMGRGINHTWCDRVAIDDRRVGQLAAEYLLELGHRRVGYLGRFDSFFDLRFQGFSHYLRRHGIEPTVFGLQAEAFQEAARRGIDILDLLIERYKAMDNRPTGLFVPGDLITNQLYPALIRNGVAPGEQVEIVSTDNVKALRVGMNPQPAAVDIHADRIGVRAVDQLLWRIEHPGEPAQQILLEPHLIEPKDIDLRYDI